MESVKPVHVQHDATERKFFVRLDEGEARLNYLVSEPEGKTWDFLHVYVPPHARGHGLAEQVVIAGFEAARAAGVSVVPTCPYVAHTFLRRYPQYQPLVSGGTGVSGVSGGSGDVNNLRFRCDINANVPDPRQA
jgi:predicted GNAT family acetyltransferase